MTDNVPDLSSIFGGSASQTDVLNKLLTSDDIELKTFITNTQARAIFKLRWMYELNHPDNKDKSEMEILFLVINYYLSLITSINGNRSKLVTDTLKEMRPTIEEKSLIGELGK